MALFRELPYPGMNFLVDMGTGDSDGQGAGVMHVQLPEARVDVIEYRNGNEKNTNPRQLQALSRYTPLVLQRGYAGGLDWYQWWNQLRNGDVAARRNVAVHLLTEDRSAVVTSWRFLDARPSAWQVANFDALHPVTLIERLELVVQRMEVE
ncbi:MAG TPA: phage tail protein [Gemmatimonadaceae bacterium]|nr:phage tail protein [Gemmatimonadaceae bacterium]